MYSRGCFSVLRNSLGLKLYCSTKNSNSTQKSGLIAWAGLVFTHIKKFEFPSLTVLCVVYVYVTVYVYVYVYICVCVCVCVCVVILSFVTVTLDHIWHHCCLRPPQTHFGKSVQSWKRLDDDLVSRSFSVPGSERCRIAVCDGE